MDAPIIGIALGIPRNKARTGPFGQFQDCGDDVESLTALVNQLARRIPDMKLDPGIAKTKVEVFKKEADTVIEKLAGVGRPEKEDKSQKDTLSSGLSAVELAILELYRNRSSKPLYTEAQMVPALINKFGKIQIESGVDDLVAAEMLQYSHKAYSMGPERLPYSDELVDGDDTAYSITPKGRKYLVKKMNKIAFRSKTSHVDEIMRKGDERRGSFGKS